MKVSLSGDNQAPAFHLLAQDTQPKAYIYVTDMMNYQICTKEAIIYGTVLLHVR